ncbi:hypothetical protein CFREI_12955 [Corynebacterium freiburgense]|nr:hypothetical protein CFREI_12955 [Corynebacterium freiburgense]
MKTVRKLAPIAALVTLLFTTCGTIQDSKSILTR